MTNASLELNPLEQQRLKIAEATGRLAAATAATSESQQALSTAQANEKVVAGELQASLRDGAKLFLQRADESLRAIAYFSGHEIQSNPDIFNAFLDMHAIFESLDLHEGEPILIADSATIENGAFSGDRFDRRVETYKFMIGRLPANPFELIYYEQTDHFTGITIEKTPTRVRITTPLQTIIETRIMSDLDATHLQFVDREVPTITNNNPRPAIAERQHNPPKTPPNPKLWKELITPDGSTKAPLKYDVVIGANEIEAYLDGLSELLDGSISQDPASIKSAKEAVKNLAQSTQNQ